MTRPLSFLVLSALFLRMATPANSDEAPAQAVSEAASKLLAQGSFRFEVTISVSFERAPAGGSFAQTGTYINGGLYRITGTFMGMPVEVVGNNGKLASLDSQTGQWTDATGSEAPRAYDPIGMLAQAAGWYKDASWGADQAVEDVPCRLVQGAADNVVGMMGDAPRPAEGMPDPVNSQRECAIGKDDGILRWMKTTSLSNDENLGTITYTYEVRFLDFNAPANIQIPEEALAIVGGVETEKQGG